MDNPQNTMHTIPTGQEEILVHGELDELARTHGLRMMMEHLLIGTIKGAVVLRFENCLVEMRTDLLAGGSDLCYGSGMFAPRMIDSRADLYLPFLFASAVTLDIKKRLGEF